MVRFLSDPENVVREEDIIDHSLEGSLEHAIAVLESYRGRGNDITIERESDYEGGYYLMIKWWRELSPEEIAANEASAARYEEEAAAREREQFERLKAKFAEPPHVSDKAEG